MKKYIIPVAAFLLIGTIANAQTDKKTPPKMTTTKPTTAKPATAGASKMAKPAPKMAVDSTKHATTGTAMKRKPHPKAAPKKTATK
jgi:hypothetical protein